MIIWVILGYMQAQKLENQVVCVCSYFKLALVSIL